MISTVCGDQQKIFAVFVFIFIDSNGKYAFQLNFRNSLSRMRVRFYTTFYVAWLTNDLKKTLLLLLLLLLLLSVSV